MASTYGKHLKVTIFGESHGPAIGMVAEGFPPGETIDRPALMAFLARRSAAGKAYATKRKEPDIPIFMSGVREEGDLLTILHSPLSVRIENTAQRSADYAPVMTVPRPGHADLTAWMRYGEAADYRGGGHFSGRLTAPLCVVGGIAKQILSRRGVEVEAQMIEVGGQGCRACDPATGLYRVSEADAAAMTAAMAAAAADGDSVGGRIQCVVTGLAAGSCGDHMFDGMEGRIAQAVFGVPAVKGIEFGSGFAGTAWRGSQNNDPFYMAPDGTVRTRTNHHGGILGGIASGMPIVFQVAVKPTPSIYIEQDSVDLARGVDTKLSIKGRHDPCIVERAVPCIEAAAALAVLDALLG